MKFQQQPCIQHLLTLFQLQLIQNTRQITP